MTRIWALRLSGEAEADFGAFCTTLLSVLASGKLMNIRRCCTMPWPRC
jgi:hypothetical protein